MIDKTDSKKILMDILAIKSVNGIDDEGLVAEYIMNYLLSYGIEANLQRIDNRHANIIATIKGRDSTKQLLLNGHIDTVPYGNILEWNTDPSIPYENNGYIFARGASDMKSGLAAIIYSLVAIKEAGNIPKYDILFVGTCNEEKTGLGAQNIINSDLISRVKEVIIAEPTGLNIGIAQKGCLWLSYTIKGKTSHGAYPEKGINAIELAYYVANEIKKCILDIKHVILGNSTAQITQIIGGVAPNMTPDSCNVLMDIRLTPGCTKDYILGKLEEIKANIIRDNDSANIEYHFVNERMPVEIDKNDSFVEEFKKIIKKEKIEPEYIGINYFTDASIFLKVKDMKVILFGPGEPQLCHQANESIELIKYYKSIDILMGYLIG